MGWVQSSGDDQVQRILGGDIDALASWWISNEHRVHAYLFTICRPHEEHVEDLLQETFLTGYKLLASRRFEGEKKDLLAFFFHIAKNKAHNLLRRLQRRERITPGKLGTEEAELVASQDEPPLTVVVNVMLLEKIDATIRELPLKEQEVFNLRFVDEMKSPEIAKMTGLSAGNVRVIIHRIRKMLRERLQEFTQV